MTEWPPRDAESLKLWLLDELPILRERRELLIERIEKGEATLHQPVTSRLSQVNIARTTTSDPTHDVVEVWTDQLPALRRELESIDAVIGEYDRVKGALTERQRKVIVLTFDHYLGAAEVLQILFISRATFYRDQADALDMMASILEWQRGP